MLKGSDPYFKYYFCLHANETLNRLEQTPKLVIAALEGHTVGGGLEIAMAADLLIAKKGSGKIGLPEVNLGVLPGTGGTQRLARRVGKNRAIDLMVTGRLIDFEEAKEIGIVNYIYEGDDFLGQVHDFARQFCPPNMASKAVGRIKRSVQSGAEVPFESGLAIERELQQQLFESQDAKEGLDAYVEQAQGRVQGGLRWRPASRRPRRRRSGSRPKLWIGGDWVEPEGGRVFVTENPATEEPLCEVASASAADVDRAVQAARGALRGAWGSTSARERGRLLWKLADALEEHIDELARLETLDNGKPIFESRYVDVPGAVEALRYYAGWADKVTGETLPVDGPFVLAYTLREPVGVVGAITPWNFPLIQAVWKIAPALACGNTVVHKPASYTPLTALVSPSWRGRSGSPPGC